MIDTNSRIRRLFLISKNTTFGYISLSILVAVRTNNQSLTRSGEKKTIRMGMQGQFKQQRQLMPTPLLHSRS